jgi:hypothetical protein
LGRGKLEASFQQITRKTGTASDIRQKTRYNPRNYREKIALARMKPEENLTGGRTSRFPQRKDVSMLGFRVSAVWSAVIGLAFAAAAQTSNTLQSKEMVVGLSLDSNYVRIADFLPRLRDSLVKQHRKQFRLVALDGNPRRVAGWAQVCRAFRGRRCFKMRCRARSGPVAQMDRATVS